MVELESLDPDRLKIVSVAHEDSPIGVNYTKPAWQIVHINGPVQDWEFRKVGHNKYLLSIDGYRYTGVLNGKVIASTHPEHEAEWEITHHIDHIAYTIALANKPHLGWTVPVNISEGHQVEIKPIGETGSIPPHFLHTQLFRFKEAD